jgi:hypothetical protein
MGQLEDLAVLLGKHDKAPERRGRRQTQSIERYRYAERGEGSVLSSSFLCQNSRYPARLDRQQYFSEVQLCSLDQQLLTLYDFYDGNDWFYGTGGQIQDRKIGTTSIGYLVYLFSSWLTASIGWSEATTREQTVYRMNGSTSTCSAATGSGLATNLATGSVYVIFRPENILTDQAIVYDYTGVGGWKFYSQTSGFYYWGVTWNLGTGNGMIAKQLTSGDMNKWYLSAFTFNGTVFATYWVDLSTGVLTESLYNYSARTIAPSGSTLYLGATPLNLQKFTGSFARLSIMPGKILTSAEILAIAGGNYFVSQGVIV